MTLSNPSKKSECTADFYEFVHESKLQGSDFNTSMFRFLKRDLDKGCLKLQHDKPLATVT
jgi:hypothetical protein